MPPKVSCVMPICYGEKYLVQAIRCFLAQDYPGEMELVIVDNNVDRIRMWDLNVKGLNETNYRYIRTQRKPVGALRNEGIKEANGEVIVIWDEDDWHASNRVSTQVRRLIHCEKAVTGWHNVLYWDEVTSGTYKYVWATPGIPYAMGASHCFWKSWWEKHPYVEQGIEDQIFSDEAMHRGVLDSCYAGQLYVARIHDGNALHHKTNLGTKQWPRVGRNEFPKEFFASLGDR